MSRGMGELGPLADSARGWQAQVKWPRLTGDVETSEERGKTTRSLYLSQSKVSIDHLIQHCRLRQTFIIGVSGDSPNLSLSPVSRLPAAAPQGQLTFPSMTTNPNKQPQPAHVSVLRTLLPTLEPQLELNLDLAEADKLLSCSV